MSPRETEEQLKKVEFFIEKENRQYIILKKQTSELMRIAEELEGVWMKETTIKYQQQEGDLVYSPHLFK